MATVYVTHPLYPDNPHLFIVDLKQIVKLKGEANTSFSRNRRGEHFWEFIIYTSGLNSAGERLGTYWADVVGSEATVDELLKEKIKEICAEIDWTKRPGLDEDLEAGVDRFSPRVYWQYPESGDTNVPIDSRIILMLKDELPAKGIDFSTITMTVDGFSVTPDITGNPFNCTVSYRPIVGE